MKSPTSTSPAALLATLLLAIPGPAQDWIRAPEEALDDRSNFVTYDIRVNLDNDAK